MPLVIMRLTEHIEMIIIFFLLTPYGVSDETTTQSLRNDDGNG